MKDRCAGIAAIVRLIKLVSNASEVFLMSICQEVFGNANLDAEAIFHEMGGSSITAICSETK